QGQATAGAELRLAAGGGDRLPAGASAATRGHGPGQGAAAHPGRRSRSRSAVARRPTRRGPGSRTAAHAARDAVLDRRRAWRRGHRAGRPRRPPDRDVLAAARSSAGRVLAPDRRIGDPVAPLCAVVADRPEERDWTNASLVPELLARAEGDELDTIVRSLVDAGAVR